MPTASASMTREARRFGRERIMAEASGDRVGVSTRKRLCAPRHVGGTQLLVGRLPPRSRSAGCYPATTECATSMVSFGSMHCATKPPPGTSIGPFMTCAPSSFSVLANSTVLCHSQRDALPDRKGPGESEPARSLGRVRRVAGWHLRCIRPWLAARPLLTRSPLCQTAGEGGAST